MHVRYKYICRVSRRTSAPHPDLTRTSYLTCTSYFRLTQTIWSNRIEARRSVQPSTAPRAATSSARATGRSNSCGTQWFAGISAGVSLPADRGRSPVDRPSRQIAITLTPPAPPSPPAPSLQTQVWRRRGLRINVVSERTLGSPQLYPPGINIRPRVEDHAQDRR